MERILFFILTVLHIKINFYTVGVKLTEHFTTVNYCSLHIEVHCSYDNYLAAILFKKISEPTISVLTYNLTIIHNF